MTFKGATYETMIDIERLIFVEEERRDLYLMKYKTFIKQGYKEAASETLHLLNLQNNLVEELHKSKDTLRASIDKLETQLTDMEFQVFLARFIDNKKHEEIMYELNISSSVLHMHLTTIKDRLDNTSYGKTIDNILRDDDKAQNKPYKTLSKRNR